MKIPKLLLYITTLFTWHGSAHALFVQPEPVPIDRLLKSAEAYLAANPKSAEAHYTLARINSHDITLDARPMEGFEALVSYESSSAFIRLAEKDPQHRESKSELAKALAEVKAGLARIGQLPQRAVTPIVFSLQTSASIEDLLAPETVVDFDLRGYGPAQRWPWMKPNTALLVWDPEGKGEIRSARQLFGGYTFEIFWKDGYAALAALDDDGDGALRGAELDGLRAWFDADGNGRSEPGEVRDLEKIDVASPGLVPSCTTLVP